MVAQSAVWVDGVQQTSLNLPDRGLNFGDGVFETILVRAGKPLFIDYHIRRLISGLGALSFPACGEQAAFYIEQAARKAAEIPWAAMRLTVTRGAGPRGYAPPEQPIPRFVIETSSLSRDCSSQPSAIQLGVASVRLSRQPALAGVKHLNRLEQVIASNEMRVGGFDEGIMCDDTGRVISAIAGNVFLWRDGELHTPAIQDCGVVGTRRELVRTRWAPAEGIIVREVDLYVEDLQSAEEILYTNSLIGICSVRKFEASSWTEYPIANVLYKRYQEALQC